MVIKNEHSTMSNPITLKKLANLSNFSISTVSKALADSPEISSKTKEKVKKLAKLYNYTPNLLAKNLKERKTRTIGVIIPNILAHFFAKVLVGIEKEAVKHGYNIITCISDESYEKEVKSIQMLASGSVDGFIISVSKGTYLNKNYEHLTAAIAKNLPVLLFDRITDKVTCDKVVINDFESSYNATKKMIDSGCKNVIFVSPINNTSVGVERVRGYHKALEDCQIPTISAEILIIEDYKKFSNSFNTYIENNKIDGVLAADELSAIYTMNLVIGKGLKVPEDVSIIGFTDGILSENSNPPLTTIDQHGIELGEVATKKLIERLQKEDYTKDYETITVNTTLIKRGSSAINL